MIKARNRLAVRNNKLVSNRVQDTAGSKMAVTVNDIETAAMQELAYNFALSGTSRN